MPLLPVNINRPFFLGKSRDIIQGQKKVQNCIDIFSIINESTWIYMGFKTVKSDDSKVQKSVSKEQQ
jgi:hypothetical protein